MLFCTLLIATPVIKMIGMNVSSVPVDTEKNAKPIIAEMMNELPVIFFFLFLVA